MKPQYFSLSVNIDILYNQASYPGLSPTYFYYSPDGTVSPKGKAFSSFGFNSYFKDGKSLFGY